MKRIAYLVLGPPHSGATNVMRLLVENGCAGAAYSRQPFDDPADPSRLRLPGGLPERIAVYRTFPHQGRLPDTREVCAVLSAANHAVHVLVVHDETRAIVRRMSKADRSVAVAQCARVVVEAYEEIERQLKRALFAAYTDVINTTLDDRRYVAQLLRELGLGTPRHARAS